MTMYVQPTLANYLFATCTFDPWMLKGMHDIFAVVVSFISSNWEAKHVIIGLFEMIDTCGITMAPKLQELLDMFIFTKKIIAYVKDEGSNLHTCANALNFVVSCNNLGLLEPFDGSCFVHALSKVCQYIITYDKVCTCLNYASIKATQGVIQKCITWPKNSSKGR
jgi:hypothetical protein